MNMRTYSLNKATLQERTVLFIITVKNIQNLKGSTKYYQTKNTVITSLVNTVNTKLCKYR